MGGLDLTKPIRVKHAATKPGGGNLPDYYSRFKAEFIGYVGPQGATYKRLEPFMRDGNQVWPMRFSIAGNLDNFIVHPSQLEDIFENMEVEK